MGKLSRWESYLRGFSTSKGFFRLRVISTIGKKREPSYVDDSDEITQQQVIERELGGPRSKALITLYKLVYCCFCIFLLEEFSWDPLKIDSFAINNANAHYTTTSQPVGEPRAPFESSYYVL